MATEEGIVIELESTTAWVKTTKSSACKGCASRDSCHAAGNEMKVEAINVAGAQVGDRVVLSFKTSSLLKATFLLYVFPILFMIFGAIIGQKIAPLFDMNASAFSAITAFLFFFISVLFIKSKANKLAKKNEYRPKIVRIL